MDSFFGDMMENFGYVFGIDGALISEVLLDGATNHASRPDITLVPPPGHEPGDSVGWSGSAWIVEPRQDGGTPSMDDIKVEKWREIKARRLAEIDGGVLFEDMLFDSDESARSNVAGVFLRAMVAEPGWTTRFTLADNTPVTLTRQQVLDLGPAVFAHVDAQHEIARGLRAQIFSADTTEQVASIAWPPLPSI